MTWAPTLGAIYRGPERGTQFCVWAPEARQVELVVESGPPMSQAMERHEDGYFRLSWREAVPGTRYRYAIDDRGPFPDPASRFQPEGVHGPSQVVDPRRFAWTDDGWRGIGLTDLVLYELHVGTFTPEGTWLAAAAKLPWLAELGVTAVELMPVADFAGDRNWGYDGVALFAPARCYGSPDDLRAFVDAAHGTGIAVHLDVVYNHLGPDGAYQGSFSRWYYSDVHRSPWGQGINFDGPESEPVRRYVVENALYWIHEYHIDGLRLDATHAIVDEGPWPIEAEIATAVHESPRGRTPAALVIAEDHRNLTPMIRPVGAGGWGLDGVWSDDFHHQMRRLMTGDEDGYFADFAGTASDIAATIRDGWFFKGQHSTYFQGPRGSDPAGLPLSRFVMFVQNHDQVGNRALGERLHHVADQASFRAASVLLLALPETPLLFMGQEWAARAPFRYFTDHHEALGRAVTAGRRREFRRFARFADEQSASRIPDPQARDTFESCRLNWDERGEEPHAGTLRLYRRLLALRRSEPALRHVPASGDARVTATGSDVVVVTRCAPGARTIVVAARLCGRDDASVDVAPAARGSWGVLFTTGDPVFAPDVPAPVVSDGGRRVHFTAPGAVILASDGEE